MRIIERPVMLETLLERLVVVGGGAGDARPGWSLVKDGRQRWRVVHLFGERRRLEEGRDAVVAVVVRVLDAAEGIARHHRCDEGGRDFPLSTCGESPHPPDLRLGGWPR